MSWDAILIMLWLGIVCALAGCSSSDTTAEFPSLGEHEVIIVHDPQPAPLPELNCPPYGEKAKGKGPCR